MPCNYGGRIVPGDRASCIGGGGNWVEDVAPIQRGGVQITDPRSKAYDEQVTSLFQSIPGVGVAGKPHFILKNAQKSAQPVAKQAEKLIPSSPAPTTGIFNRGVEKLAGQARQHPVLAATAAATPVVSLMGSDGPVTDKKVVQQGSASPLFTRQQLKARNIALNEAKASGDTATVDKILKAETAPTEAYTKAKSGTPWAQLAAGAKVTDADQMALDSASQTPEPADKEKVESGLSSLWSNMQKPGYWSEQVEGGAGDWDNRLFRLGEMMSYMGTPLSKRGDNPAKRWTSANTEQSKIKAAIEKERIKATNKEGANIFSKIGNKTMVNAIQEKVAKKMGKDKWTRLDPAPEDVEQTSNEAIIAIQSMMSKVNPSTGVKYTYNEAEQMVLDSIK